MLELHEDTIFHAAVYLDKYIALKNPPANQLQLLAVTCLAIASKVNEIYPAYFSNIVSMFRLNLKLESYSEM